MSDIFGKFVENILVPLHYNVEEVGFMNQLRFAGGKYSDFSEILKDNVKITDTFLKLVNQKFKGKVQEPVTSLEVALSLVGFNKSRDLLASAMKRTNATRDSQKEDPFSLQYALLGESHGGKYATDFFVGGLIFDILDSVVKLFIQTEDDQKRLDKSIQDLWKHSLEIVRVAAQFQSAVGSTMDLSRELVLDGLLHDVGKFFFYHLEGDEEVARVREGVGPKKNRNVPLQNMLIEQKLYRFHHAIFSHLITWRLGFLPDTAWVVKFHHEPYLALKHGSHVHARATLICLADLAVRYRETMGKLKIPENLIKGWFGIARSAFKDCPEKTFSSALNSYLTM